MGRSIFVKLFSPKNFLVRRKIYEKSKILSYRYFARRQNNRAKKKKKKREKKEKKKAWKWDFLSEEETQGCRFAVEKKVSPLTARPRIRAHIQINPSLIFFSRFRLFVFFFSFYRLRAEQEVCKAIFNPFFTIHQFLLLLFFFFVLPHAASTQTSLSSLQIPFFLFLV